jgi:hypothetical protein
MFDDLERLREDPRLAALLAHYAEEGAADREAWQDRVMVLDGLPPEAVVKLHGALLAYDWIEQNTGATGEPQGGAVPRCYRVTAAGRRALRGAHLRPDAEEAEAA